ncbi:hypothetical protein GW17_00032607 [Ensete ventricosum]|nr:hypothetical protein GW17_00032607 [Ensete ventricosum]
MMADTLRLAINCDSSSASFSSQLMATCEAASQVDQLPHSASIVFDAGEPTSASQVDPEAQLPPPPTDDDPPATFLEKVVQQLSLSVGMVASVGPTARNHDDELAFKLYHLVVFTIYGFDIHHLQTMGPVRQAATPANSRVMNDLSGCMHACLYQEDVKTVDAHRSQHSKNLGCKADIPSSQVDGGSSSSLAVAVGGGG